jgi:hypothetical protein
MSDDIIRMAEQVEAEGFAFPLVMPEIRRLCELVRADEREAIMDEWWMCVQSDLENGVKSLNERAAEKWKKEYPAIAGFAATIEARGNT